MAPRIAQYQLRRCKPSRVGCPVCADGRRNYYYKPIKCPHLNKNALEDEVRPEMESESESELPIK